MYKLKVLLRKILLGPSSFVSTLSPAVLIACCAASFGTSSLKDTSLTVRISNSNLLSPSAKSVFFDSTNVLITRTFSFHESIEAFDVAVSAPPADIKMQIVLPE